MAYKDKERQRETQRLYRLKNKEKIRELNVARYNREKDKIRAEFKKRRDYTVFKSLEYLSSHPCVDCGESDVVVLDYDHVRGIKTCDVSVLIDKARKWEMILAEITKCEVRCANCHRRKTFGHLEKFQSFVSRAVNVDYVAA